MTYLGLKDQHETFMHLCSSFFVLISWNEASSSCERLKTSWKSFRNSVSLTLKTGHLWIISPGIESAWFTALQKQPQPLLQACLLLFAEICATWQSFAHLNLFFIVKHSRSSWPGKMGAEDLATVDVYWWAALYFLFCRKLLLTQYCRVYAAYSKKKNLSNSKYIL